jgi:hypothetical protein
VPARGAPRMHKVMQARMYLHLRARTYKPPWRGIAEDQLTHCTISALLKSFKGLRLYFIMAEERWHFFNKYKFQGDLLFLRMHIFSKRAWRVSLEHIFSRVRKGP